MGYIHLVADDFGLCKEVNEATCFLHDRGVIDRVSFIVNTEFFDKSVENLKKRPALEVGVHLNLTDGKPVLSTGEVRSLTNAWGTFPGGRHYQVLWRLLTGRIRVSEVKKEWRAQIVKAKNAGLEIRHLNSHGHLHLLPQLHSVFLDLVREFDIPYVRLLLSGTTLKSRLYRIFSGILAREISRSKTDVFFPHQTLGIDRQGRLTKEDIVSELGKAGSCIVEFLLHPSKGVNPYHELWRYSAEGEFGALSSPEVLQALRRHRSFSDAVPPPGNEISLFIPVYNAARFIRRDLRKSYEALSRLSDQFEIVIVDDNSTDKSYRFARVINQAGPTAGKEVRYLRYDRGPSRRENLARSFAAAKHGVIGYIDADFSCDISCLLRAIKLLQSTSVDIVIGSRYIAGARATRRLSRRILSFFYNLTLRLLFGSKIRDHQCGLKVFRRDAVMPIINEMGYDEAYMRGWFWDAELLIRAQKKEIGIIEMPVDYRYEDISTFSFLREIRCLRSIWGLKRRLC